MKPNVTVALILASLFIASPALACPPLFPNCNKQRNGFGMNNENNSRKLFVCQVNEVRAIVRSEDDCQTLEGYVVINPKADPFATTPDHGIICRAKGGVNALVRSFDDCRAIGGTSKIGIM